ncbi:alpha/beta hydrolase family protein [Kribbella sp. NPDC051620]|uniref:alpha/beta hydrolase family protein n=1 Tax=Kribbella sp. NPDC051620 TaxID=3364120 RepID=UPI00378EA21D
MIQRRIIAAALATAFAALAVPVATRVGPPVATAAPVAEAVAASTPYRVVLPEPTGPYGIGTAEVHLVDARRADPWQPGKWRELMVSVWYPTRGIHRQFAPYADPAVAPALGAEMASLLRLPGDSVDLGGSTTHARHHAKPCGRHPVLLYSPPSGVSRVIGTNQAEELASRGYVVVTIDHTGEAPVEFPGGRVVDALLPWTAPGAVKKATDTRVADVRFVLDSLPGLPRRLSHAMDLSRIGMYGYSMGGSTAASAMLLDRRISAGVNLDGGMRDGEEPSEVSRRGLDRPFLLVGGGAHSRSTDATWSSFWTAQHGWKKELVLPDGGHGSFGDYQFTLPGLARASGIDPAVLSEGLGTVSPDVSVAFTRHALSGFFGEFLKP